MDAGRGKTHLEEGHDLSNVLLETHVDHPIGLVETEVPGRIEEIPESAKERISETRLASEEGGRGGKGDSLASVQTKLLLAQQVDQPSRRGNDDVQTLVEYGGLLGHGDTSDGEEDAQVWVAALAESGTHLEHTVVSLSGQLSL